MCASGLSLLIPVTDSKLKNNYFDNKIFFGIGVMSASDIIFTIGLFFWPDTMENFHLLDITE